VGRPPARGRLRPAARQQLTTVCIPVIGGVTVWTFPVGDAERIDGKSLS
jgi:hypothetical protein